MNKSLNKTFDSQVEVPSGSELYSDQVRRTRCVPRQKLQNSGIIPLNSMIRGHFDLGMVWSGVTSVWGLYGQRSPQDGNGLIRGEFKRTLEALREEFERNWVWPETTSRGILFDFLFCFTERCWLCQEATKRGILITDTSRVWWFWSEPKGSSW